MDTEEKQTINKNIEKKDKEKENEKKINNISTLKSTNKNELNDLKEKLLNNQKKIHDIKLRHLAYIENIKKDSEIKIKNIKNIKKEEFFKKIIPIIDILEDTLSFAQKSNLDKESLVQGIQLILESLLKIIYKFGVKIEGKKNEAFNPKIHNVILTESSTEIQPDHVIQVTRKGFSFNNIIIRKASVIVSKI
ncbi:nucleotide exchange factor GrpE [Buchnera aphidicola (Aphis craccivore)]|uniref:Protein GrpE n=1 Tax=Buchnera aphidicola (Aphis craccivora) TaxID=466616 RepID=A0AA95E637_9GAMM|nr:nucleotide exchange factor GrpE [Buchnera aphidicola]QLL40582.1 nucleotide exchange factor GrpE [Buchnera aphidicola (Aphis craccivore)]WAI17952.1 MAG: nucleotide exchange factor GrpE [Buchnera aphidicola (Aphis craccivora)]